MRLAVSGNADEEFLAYARQVGATDYIGGGQDLSTDKGYYGFQELMLLRQRIEDAGLNWAVLDGLPAEWKHKIKLGLPGRDEQIANWCRTLENMGAAGVPSMGYFFSPRSSIGHYGLRTSRTTPGRGGAKVTSFDDELIVGADQSFWDPPLDRSVETTDDDVWGYMTYFLEAVIPVAEDAGVVMGCHPDDPPVSPIGGVARVLRSDSSRSCPATPTA
jgi:mannonate dehydratase